MKKIWYIIGMAAVLSSACTREEIGGVEDPANVCEITVDATINPVMINEPQTTPYTRATATCDRYVIEMYNDPACTVAANVFENGTKNQAINANGKFSMVINREQTYYCLLWADNAASEVYDVSSLKAVTLKTGKIPIEAFQGKLTIKAGDQAYSVGLTRAVAKIVLKETADLLTGFVKVKFKQNPVFNVISGKTEGEPVERIETINISEKVTATLEKPVALNDSNPIYVLAGAATADLTDFTFNPGHQSEVVTVNIPLLANRSTSIKGHYTTLPVADIGYFYYEDGTSSFEYNASTENPCLGVVFWINPSDRTKGKIVAPDQIMGLFSPISSTLESSDSKDDGSLGTRNAIVAIKDQTDFSEYKGLYWIYNTKNKSNVDGRWYIPAIEELKMMCSSNTSSIDQSVMKIVNSALDKIPDAVKLDAATTRDHWYWSATWSGGVVEMFRFNTGASMGGGASGGECCFRAISAF